MDWKTHEISNQFDELSDYKLYDTDAAMREGMERAGGGWASPALAAYGGQLGATRTWQWAAEVNRFTPEFEAFDARGRRLDRVSFHPAWHELMRMHREAGSVSMAFRDPQQRGRWSA